MISVEKNFLKNLEKSAVLTQIHSLEKNKEDLMNFQILTTLAMISASLSLFMFHKRKIASHEKNKQIIVLHDLFIKTSFSNKFN